MSRELDALNREVARHVFNGDTGCSFVDEDGCQHMRLPQYSTSIADAWLVVEKMFLLGWSLHVDALEDELYFVPTGLRGKKPAGHQCLSDYSATHYATAICYAAIAALA